MGRIRKQRVTAPDADVEGIDIAGWIGRLKTMAAAQAPDVDPFTADEQAKAEARKQVIDRRLARLNAAGGLDPEAAAAAAQAIAKCPCVAGHKGSEKAAASAHAYLDSKSLRTLILGGPTGRGKSYVSTWIIAEWQQSSAWMAANEVRVSDTWSALRPKVETTKLLVIDDLGRESTDWAGREIADVIELRHNRGLRTVATTNLTRDQVFARYGERLASRLNDSRLALLVDVLGPDLRKR
jgi:DNA replication protein DnaC